MRFDLVDLRLFLAVVDAGSITHGAADIGLSLAAASERLRDMETGGGVALLSRGRRGVMPTEAGGVLAHHARTILHQMAQMRGELGQHAKALRTTVRVFANTAATSEFLPQRLGHWMVAHPRTDIELKERQSTDIARSVAGGFAEIGILSSTVAVPGLTMLPFAVDTLVMVAAPDHPFAGKSEVGFTDLLSENFICLAEGALQQHIDMQALKLGAKLKCRVALRNFDGICRMAGQGIGIAIIPDVAARRAKRATGISVVRLTDAWATRQLSVCVRSDASLTPDAVSLFDHLAGFAQ